jgi:membrane protease YdiL (CAAX protease family)
MAPQPALTRRRALLELALAYTLILLVIWTPRPGVPGELARWGGIPYQRIFYIAAVIAVAAILTLSFQSARALGITRTNLTRSLWIAAVALALAAALILTAAHLHTLHNTSHFIARYWGYALWAFVQQIILLDIFLRRLQLLLPSPRFAALAAAVLFASAHLPNPILVPITLLWGFISCLLFLHYRNIIPLAIAHAALGITLAIAIPSPVIRNMRVGLGFLHYRNPQHAHVPVDLTRSSKLGARN